MVVSTHYGDVMVRRNEHIRMERTSVASPDDCKDVNNYVRVMTLAVRGKRW